MVKFTLICVIVALLVCLGSTAPLNADETPKPYTFTIESVDEFGNTLTRTESGDGSGTVKGSYSYRDTDGVYRIADYISDADGFRVSVRTNEPGVGKHQNGDPADTSFEVEEPPAGIYEKYAKASPAAGRG
ncbi:cuticle protein-like protein [Leptotrombidium deliense]|uniref:Cuticle protein-like protein n=1 Tax=Leptotrombidium deliense TaxID=299467 RepID=A0A443SNB0_9ACAR|nr:cuticle protein-like protein [Leptotrombidium deliense]